MDCCVQCGLVYDKHRACCWARYLCSCSKTAYAMHTETGEKLIYFVLGHPGIACLADFKENNFLQLRLPWVSEFHSQFVGFLKLIWGETGLWIASCTSVLMGVAFVAFLYSQNKTPKLTINTWSGTNLGYRMLGEQLKSFHSPKNQYWWSFARMVFFVLT